MTVDVPAPERPAVCVHARAAQPAVVRVAPVVQTLHVPVEIPVPAREWGASVDHLARVRAVDPLSRVGVAIVVRVE